MQIFIKQYVSLIQYLTTAVKLQVNQNVKDCVGRQDMRKKQY